MKTLTSFLLILFALQLRLCRAERVSYAGYALYRSTPQTNHQLQGLRHLMEERREGGLQFWTEPGTLNHTVDMLVAPEERDNLRELLRSLQVPTKIIMHDVGEVIKLTSSVHPTHRKSSGRLFDNCTRELGGTLMPDVFYTRYSRYATIESKLKQLALDPRVSLEVSGKSFEGRNLYLVKISTDASANKPVIFLDAGHHAREWISHATLLYIMESLLNEQMPKIRQKSRQPRAGVASNEIEDTSLKGQLNDYDFWFVPVVNPDGYEYSHTTDRNWRKTRSINAPNYCSGADPNRNYPHHWSEAGTSSYSCSDIYAGVRALSEPETASLAKILQENKQRIKMYLSLHAYSQLILLPYGYDRVKTDNYEQMMSVAEAGARAIDAIRSTKYRCGNSAMMLYPAAGGSDDFAHGICNIRQAFTVELPDTGFYGFLLPPDQIIPVGQETVGGISAMIDAMRMLPKNQ